MKTEKQMIFKPKNLESRIYINYTKNRVFIYKNRRQLEDPYTLPYIIMTIDEFKSHFKLRK